MNTAAIIEKWYKRIGFDSRYDRAFYNALKTIVIDPAATVYTLDKNQQDGKKNFLSYLYFCEALSAFYAEKGIPENILMDTLSDLPRWLDVWSGLKGELYLENTGWLNHHFRGELFQLGRLQFCMSPASGMLCPLGIDKGEPIVDIHIPAAGPMTPASCAESIAQARQFFPTFFPDYEFRCFTCVSWLLDPTLREILKPESNILQFQKMFALANTHPSDSLLGYIFPWKTTREDLPALTPDTPFAQKVKDRIMQGGEFYTGYGVIWK